MTLSKNKLWLEFGDYVIFWGKIKKNRTLQLRLEYNCQPNAKDDDYMP
jgi:hypothetical protein